VTLDDLRRKLTSVEEQNRELVVVNAKREDALQQAKVLVSFLLALFLSVCKMARIWANSA